MNQYTKNTTQNSVYKFASNSSVTSTRTKRKKNQMETDTNSDNFQNLSEIK